MNLFSNERRDDSSPRVSMASHLCGRITGCPGILELIRHLVPGSPVAESLTTLLETFSGILEISTELEPPACGTQLCS